MDTHLPRSVTAIPQRAYGWHLASLLLVGAALAALITPVHAADDPPGRVGRLARLDGQAWLYDGEKREWLETGVNQPLTSGDRLSIASDGRAVLQVGSTTVRLDNASELEFTRINDEQIALTLVNGGMAVQLVAPEVVRDVVISTTEAQFLPRRTGHYRIDRRDGISFAGVWNGELAISAPGMTQTLYRGQRLELWQEGAGGTRSAMHANENDAFSDWVTRSQNETARSVSQNYLSPEMTGADDLDRYGRWEDHGDYGPLWYPAVTIGWAPYRHGHWAWVRPWGWTWIDSAPWGFAPFHYGRWISIGGRWAWAPGSRIARPVYAPALVDWPGGLSVDLSIRLGGGPPAGWIPLAPRQIYQPYYRVTPGYRQHINQPHAVSPHRDTDMRGSWSSRSDRDERPEREPRDQGDARGPAHAVAVPGVNERTTDPRTTDPRPAERPWQRTETPRTGPTRHPERPAEMPMAREAETPRARMPAIETPRPTAVTPPVISAPREVAPAEVQKPMPMPRGELQRQKSARDRDDDERPTRGGGNRRAHELER